MPKCLRSAAASYAGGSGGLSIGGGGRWCRMIRATTSVAMIATTRKRADPIASPMTWAPVKVPYHQRTAIPDTKIPTATTVASTCITRLLGSVMFGWLTTRRLSDPRSAPSGATALRPRRSIVIGLRPSMVRQGDSDFIWRPGSGRVDRLSAGAGDWVGRTSPCRATRQVSP